MRGERDNAARATFLEAMRRGESVTSAAAAAGLTRQAPRNWANRGDAEVKAALAEARARRARSGRAQAPEVGGAPPDAATGSGDASGDAQAGDLAELRRLTVARLTKILSDDEAAPGVHVHAAKVAAALTGPARAPAASARAEATPDPRAVLRVLEGRAAALLAGEGA